MGADEKDKMVDRLSAQENPINVLKPKNTRYGVDNVGAAHTRASLRPAASRCNSQTALIPTLKPKRAISGKRMFFSFPCCDKKDVRINHHHTRARYQEEETEIHLEESRNSIQVFGSGATTLKAKGRVAKNMERKLPILTWIAIPKAHNIADSRDGDDDGASDASSDLFEIETISGATHPMIMPHDDASAEERLRRPPCRDFGVQDL